MRIKAGMLLAAFALAVPLAAQTAAQPAKPSEATEKLFKLEVSGLGG